MKCTVLHLEIASLYSSFFREGDWLASESRFAGLKPKQKKQNRKKSH